MTDTVEANGASQSSGIAEDRYELNQIIDQDEALKSRATEFHKLAEGALDKALLNSLSHDPLGDLRSEVDGNATAEMRRTKAEVLSDVSRPGAETREVNDSTEARMDALVDRTNQLYRDISIHQVAWGVATRMQKDISQLLRGG